MKYVIDIEWAIWKYWYQQLRIGIGIGTTKNLIFALQIFIWKNGAFMSYTCRYFYLCLAFASISNLLHINQEHPLVF